jgi:hypothetical protein
MKNLLVILLILSAGLNIQAQNFEGIITWKITTEMDAATKAQMNEAQQKMNDPATQAQMKEMRDKMNNDPEFKKMMESNPAMKAQMEAMMKMAEGGNINTMIPTGFTVKIKDQNTWSKMEGGMMGNTEFLYLKNKNLTYHIDREAKTYSVSSFEGLDTVKLSDVKVTKTGETAKIMGYNCTKYIAESTVQGRKVQQFFWTTTEIKGLDMKSLAQQQARNNQHALFYKKIEGVPLKMEMKQPEMTMIMEVTAIKKQSLPASDFAIPAGFKEVK